MKIRTRYFLPSTRSITWPTRLDFGFFFLSGFSLVIFASVESGKTYRANDKHCQCEAFFRDQPCKHRALYRLTVIEETETAPVAVSRPPRITRSVERDRTGVKYNVVRIDGWAI
jgi:hypothetical protein